MGMMKSVSPPIGYQAKRPPTGFSCRKGRVVHFTFSDTFTRDLNADGTHRWRSGILHIAPGHSAGHSLRHAIRTSGRTDDVINFRDDLSCGPIDSQASSARARWWGSMYDEYGEHDVDFDGFWQQIMSTPDRLVVWFGRHSAREHAFFLAPWIASATAPTTSSTSPGCNCR